MAHLLKVFCDLWSLDTRAEHFDKVNMLAKGETGQGVRAEEGEEQGEA